MADRGYVQTLLNRADDATKAIFAPIFEHLLTTYQIGDSPKATNFSWFRLEGKTPGIANTEFSILHGLPGPPALLLPVMDLRQIGSQLVPLQVSRAPDGKRVYLRSSSTNAPFVVYVE